MTLRLISGSPQNVVEQVQRPGFRRFSCSVPNSSLSRDKLKNPTYLSESTDDLKSLPSRNITEQHQRVPGPHSSPDRIQDSACPSSQSQTYPHMEEIMRTNYLMNQELVLHDKKDEQQLACSSSTFNQFSMLSSIEKSIIEQTRSNDLKTFEIGLIMKKLQLKERQLELNSNANLLERWKLSMGLSKASFKAEKFKTQLQDSRQVELLKKCLDFLVAGLIIMLFSLGYGTYVYSHRRIIEATEACSPYTDLLTAGMDTSSTSVEWVLSELIRHPQIMKKLQKELDFVVGPDHTIEEHHLHSLEYLDIVVKETLRLHPVAPLLIPHESMEDCMVDGFHIPKKSRLLVNVWAIGRDPNVWLDPETFWPERFIRSDIDLRGRDFQLLPFGSGRRSCPGMQLGLTVVKLIVAQLVHCFDWELPNGMLPGDLDMSEHFGLVTARAEHLMAIPSYRLRK